MKKIFMTSILFSFALNGQVAIGKVSLNGTSTILDFNDTSNNSKGLILPQVNGTPTLTAANNGTFLLDKMDKKIKMYENGVWVELSASGNTSQIQANNTTESIKDQGVIIGNMPSNAKGVLVLESQNKALLLPKIVTPHTTVKSPYPGMMCYDVETKSLAVFDGSNWNYWR